MKIETYAYINDRRVRGIWNDIRRGKIPTVKDAQGVTIIDPAYIDHLNIDSNLIPPSTASRYTTLSASTIENRVVNNRLDGTVLKNGKVLVYLKIPTPKSNISDAIILFAHNCKNTRRLIDFCLRNQFNIIEQKIGNSGVEELLITPPSIPVKIVTEFYNEEIAKRYETVII